MNKKLYYEDIEEGAEVTPLVKEPNAKQLVMWAGASGDYNPIHYDKDYALKQGLPGVIVQGQLAGSFLGQMITDWIGDEGSLKKLSLSYKGKNLPGQKLTCHGTVVNKSIEEGRKLVSLRLWIENPAGEKTLTGMACISLPSRS
jgi:acyl dehydratase